MWETLSLHTLCPRGDLANSYQLEEEGIRAPVAKLLNQPQVVVDASGFHVEIRDGAHHLIGMSTAPNPRPPSRSSIWLSLVGLVVLLFGCSTYQVDWNSRIGNYTYDQAVTELGPPDKSAPLSDGSTVAEWITRRGYSRGSVGFAYGYGHPGYPYHYHYPPPFYHHYYDPPSPDYFIRLTFGPDGKLQAWKRVVR